MAAHRERASAVSITPGGVKCQEPEGGTPGKGLLHEALEGAEHPLPSAPVPLPLLQRNSEFISTVAFTFCKISAFTALAAALAVWALPCLYMQSTAFLRDCQTAHLSSYALVSVPCTIIQDICRTYAAYGECRRSKAQHGASEHSGQASGG